MSHKLPILILFCLSLLKTSPEADSGLPHGYHGKRILYINSYHPGYYWSDGELEGALDVLEPSGADIKVIHMDTKDNPDEEFKIAAGLEAKRVIEEYNPDVVIVADDNAFKYVIMPYYRDADLPVVFCGINWDISVYEAPYKNTTGMIEIALTEQLISYLKGFAAGDRVGILAYDVWDERKNVEYAADYLSEGFYRQEYVLDFKSWKDAFLALQDRVDILMLSTPEGIEGWDPQQAEEFVLEKARIPIGISGSSELISLALIGLVKIPQEQGQYAAQAALRILDGEHPSGIPVVTNRKGHLLLNLKIADKLDIVFTPTMLRNAGYIYGF